VRTVSPEPSRFRRRPIAIRIPGSRLAAAALSAGLLSLVLGQPGTPAAALSCVPPNSSITYDGTGRSDNDVYVGRVVDRGVRTTEEAFGESVDGRRYRLHVTRVLKGSVPASSTIFVPDPGRYDGAHLVDFRPGPIFVEAMPDGVANVVCGPTTQRDVEAAAARYERALRSRGVPPGTLLDSPGEPRSPASTPGSSKGAVDGDDLPPAAVVLSAIGLVAAGVLLLRRRSLRGGPGRASSAERWAREVAEARDAVEPRFAAPAAGNRPAPASWDTSNGLPPSRSGARSQME
jgi:hypothetical protein